MDDANVMDTPQPANQNDTSSAFEPAPVESSNNQVSIDDIILGSVDDSASAFTGTPEPEQPQETIPTPLTPEAPVSDIKNDETRYQYWQSRASKLENEVDGMRAQQQQAVTQPPVQPEAPVKEEFPPPPSRPEKPRNFSREEAYADSQSESARYLDDIDEWRDNSGEYNELKHQYDLAVMQEKLDGEAKIRIDSTKRREAQVAQHRQVNEISTHVQSQYNMGPEESEKFISQMSSPDSLTMDNLVQLWRFQQGQNVPSNAPVPNAPSPAFEQTQRAQQVPSPMGVHPGSSTAAQGSTEDQIMDGMIGNLRSKNPWQQ